MKPEITFGTAITTAVSSRPPRRRFVQTIFGILGVVKPPFGKVNAIAATAGFGVAFVLLKMWKIGDMFKGPLFAKLLAISVIGGLVVSIISVVKSEE